MRKSGRDIRYLGSFKRLTNNEFLIRRHYGAITKNLFQFYLIAEMGVSDDTDFTSDL